jgi:hypothetical protein
MVRHNSCLNLVEGKAPQTALGIPSRKALAIMHHQSMSLRSCNFLFGHLPGRTSLCKFTFKEGHITDKTLGIPPPVQTPAPQHSISPTLGTNPSATPAHPCLPETNPMETKTSRDKETRRKLVTHKQDFLLFLSLKN